MDAVDTILVNYASPRLTAEAVESVLAEPETGRVLVVDNASPDGSGDELARRFATAPVTVLPQSRNLGFGPACNVGARAAESPFLFFLNSDARVEPGCLGRLRDRLRAEPSVGVVAPAIRTLPAGALQVDAQGDLPTAWSILLRRTRHHRGSLAPGWVSGVAFLARREQFLGLGGFDESFFLYFEDVDLCRRYRLAGYDVVRELSASVVHLGGRSRRSRIEQQRHYYASQDRYLEIVGTPRIARALIRWLRYARTGVRPWRSGD